MYTINNEYRNSRIVNYNRWSSYNEVDLLVKELLSGFKCRKKAVYLNNMKVLVLDLYHSYLVDKEQYVAFHRNKNHYRFSIKSGDGRYIVNPHITHAGFTGAVDLLHDQGMISFKIGCHFYDEVMGEYGFLSRMRAEAKLVALWESHGLKPEMIQQYKPKEVLVLKDLPIYREIISRKDGKPKRIKVKNEYRYSDNADTRRMRKVVLAYNRQLEMTHIDCDAECLSDEDKADLAADLSKYKKDPVIKIDLSSKSVHRVFNNRSFKQGGRFYGAWWIGCPSVLRKYITLNGEPTVELDYSGVHIHLLYAMRGINYAEKQEDPYMLDDGLPNRSLNKLILLTALNAETPEDARDSVYNQLRKSGELADYNFNRSKKPIMDKLELLKEKHKPIQDDIASNKGIILQYYDSCIIEKTIQWGLEHNIPLLTVHDSVVCQTKYADLVKDKMWTYFTELVDHTMKCKIKYIRYTSVAHASMKKLPLLSKYIPPPNYNIELLQIYKPNKMVIKHTFEADEIIGIGIDNRTNKCNLECCHNARVLNCNTGRRNFLGTIKVRLVYIKGINTVVVE
jgi:hypothetical protein